MRPTRGATRGNASARRKGNTITIHPERCTGAGLDCPCKGDQRIHAEHSRELAEAGTGSQEPVDCPACGAPTTPLALVSWGNCRACRTAQSRLTHPLRW
jgi:hypothetical protein